MDHGAEAGAEPTPAPALATLARYAVAVPAVTTIADLLDALVEVASVALAADSVHVGRVDHPHGRMRVLRNAGRLASWEVPEPLEESYLIADYPQLLCTAEDAQPWRGSVVDEDIASNDRTLLTRQGKAHGLSVPVLFAGGVWGELSVTRLRSRPFSEADEEVALVIAGLTTAGVARVLGDQQLRELAYTDALTGLANRRAADEQVEAWAVDPQHAQVLTVMLCDVNGLKAVNDTHGHLVGDRLIREVAGHVSAAAGRLPLGLAARVGGDEFLIASPCSDQALVAEVVGELILATSGLSFGGGTSCGTAWAGALLRPEPSPASLVRTLLRIADAEQYRHKLRTRREAGALATALVPDVAMDRRGARAQHGVAVPPGSASGPAAPEPGSEPGSGPEPEPGSTKDRLAAVAHHVCEAAGGVAWWVSEIDPTQTTVRSVSCGTVRHTDVTDGLWPRVELDPHVYRLADFPVTERAVRQGEVFCVDTLTGDAAERQLLIQTGFQCMIAAGEVDSSGRGWLVELYGDSLTPDLHRFATRLHDAVRRVARTMEVC